MLFKLAARPAILPLAVLAATLTGPTLVEAQDPVPSETAQAIDSVFADIDPMGPGCAVGVVVDRKLAYGEGYGIANLDYQIPITTRSNFYLGSIGKQFTAAAMVHAAREGHLSLDDPVRMWIPELPDYEPTITVRNLIHHTSGIRDYLTLASLAGWEFEAPHTEEDVIGLLTRQRATNFPAGEEYLYSNSGYFLLAEIVERATGRTFREYAEDELLEPLGMDRTRIHDDRLEPLPDRVVAYEIDEGAVRINHPWNFDQVGSGGVWSSIEEMVHWDRNYYTEEAGGPGFTQQLLERGVLVDGDTIPYAFGLSHGEYRGLPTVSHGGALAGFRSYLLRFPREETTVLVLCNYTSGNPGRRAQDVADVVLADRLQPEQEEPAAAAEGKSVELTGSQLDAFTGHWRASIGIEVEIRRDTEGLVFVQGSAEVPVTIISDSVLRLEGPGVVMVFSQLDQGKYQFQQVQQGGQEFTAERFDPDTPPTIAYPALAGEYHSDDLDATYRLFEGEDGLMLEGARGEQVRLVPVDDQRLRAPFGFLQLERRGDRVVGFTLDAGRVRGLRFERVRERP